MYLISLVTDMFHIAIGTAKPCAPSVRFHISPVDTGNLYLHRVNPIIHTWIRESIETWYRFDGDRQPWGFDRERHD
jgi:hypothetical protein